MATEGDDHVAFAVNDAFTIQGELAWQQSVVCPEPGAQSAGVKCWISQLEEVVECVVAGHFEQSALLVAHAQADGFVLAWVEAGDFSSNGEHGGERVAAALGSVRVCP